MKTVGMGIAVTFALGLAGCGIQKTSADTLSAVQSSNDKLDAIRAAMHLATLAAALREMLSPENTVILRPPARMIPYATIFTREATEKELAGAVKALLVDAQSATAGQRAHALVSLTGVIVLSGTCPNGKARELLHREVEEKGLYEDVGYVFALARYDYLRDFALKPSFTEDDINGATLGAAVAALGEMKWIALLPYASRLRLQIGTLGVDDKLDRREIARLASNARGRFTRALGTEVTPHEKRLLDELTGP